NGFIAGHVPFSRAAADAFGDQWQFITILREPISRFMSEYFYNRFKASYHFRVEEDLEPYLDTADARRTSTQLTNFLTGRRDEYATPTAAEVESAVENLRRFAVVGFVEDLKRFADDMAARFGRRPAIPHTNRNPAPEATRKREIDPALRERIAELNAADLEIYRRAQQLFGLAEKQ
ncbi:MAG TPA: sulfotransferase family 2 domain-containing protein, partial [Methyloceanibacter sp.]|nr:sulfotransferase family 2 domain-containing protein [Methyloceanibacter sp.]